MRNVGSGILLILIYNVIASGSDVFLAHFLQNAPSIVVMTLNFAIVTSIFVILQLRRLPAVWNLVRANWQTVLLLNLASIIAWLGFYVSMKYLEPAASDAIVFGTGPVLAALLGGWLRPGSIILPGEKIAAAGTAVGLGVLTWVTLSGKSAVGTIHADHLALGILSAFMGGLGVVICSNLIKKLSEKGFSVPDLFASRFYLLIATGLVLWPRDFALPPMASPFWGELIIVAFLGLLIPLVLIQKAMTLCEPITASLILSLLPGFVMLGQLFDPRLTVSGYSVLGIAICIVATIVGVLARRKEEKSKVVAIVDGYSAAWQYAMVLKQKGYAVVHVQSAPEIPEPFRLAFEKHRSDYVAHVIFEGDAEQTVQELRKLGVANLWAGCETGVEVADLLAEKMKFLGNGTALSSCRRNKYEMNECVRQAGLRAVKQIKTRSAEEAIRWARAQKISPVVVKPLASAGTDNVAVCTTDLEIWKAFGLILGQRNRLGAVNQEVLVQEYLIGTEYVVNTVGVNGQRRVVDVIRYTKIKTPHGHQVYERDDFLNVDSPELKELIAYNHAMLDALGILNGPSHAEIFITKEGPVLVEVGARCDGLTDISFSRASGMVNHLELAVQGFLDPKGFLVDVPTPHVMKKHAVVIYPIVEDEGIIASLAPLNSVKHRPSFHSLILKVKEGDAIRRTEDIFTCPAYIYLLHEDKAVIEEDVLWFRALEKQGLFEFALEESVSV